MATVDTPTEFAGGAYTGTVRSKAADLKRKLIDQTIKDVESWAKAVELEWDQAHPDGVGKQSPIDPAEVESYRNKVRNEYYEWVIPTFERYLEPDPDALNPLISNMQQIETMFQGSSAGAGGLTGASGALSRINDVRTDMGHWEGRFQENFVDNFVTPLQGASTNMRIVAIVAREQLECTKSAYIAYRKNTIELLDKSIQAVDLLNNQKNPGPVKWTAIGLIAVGTLLTLATGGWAAAGAVCIISGTVWGGALPGEPIKNDLAAPTAQEVAVKIVEALSNLDRKTLDDEKKLESGMNNLSEAISSTRAVAKGTSGPLSVARPLLTTTPGEVTTESLYPDR